MSSDLSYEAIQRYWNGAGAVDALAASYGMRRVPGLPADCIRYRFNLETSVVDSWLADLPSEASILDLACGQGTWSRHFARRFRRVVGVERSEEMIDGARKAGVFPNVELIHADALRFHSDEQFDAIFLGSLLMYLNRADAVSLLRRLPTNLAPNGRLIIRESTVRSGVETVVGAHQSTYRSVDEYRRLVADAGLALVDVEQNWGYDRMVMTEDLVDLARSVPVLRSIKPDIVGKPIWWTLQATAPLSYRLLHKITERLGLQWPHLQSHFLLLRPAP